MKIVKLGDHKIVNGDCRDVMASMKPDFFDSIVCDPPYGLKFMGKEWDHGVPGVLFWTEALRVLKPGGHLVAFGGTRTFHRLAVAIEDAGFEIRDCLSWMYGQGFPKSMNVSKAIGKISGDPETEEWQGWGTALKPAWEPIILARKPFSGTVVSNVLEHGTGAINVDGTRISTDETIASHHGTSNPRTAMRDHWHDSYQSGDAGKYVQTAGRWPANVLLAHHEECMEVGTRQVKTGTAVHRHGVDSGGYGGTMGRLPKGTPDASYANPDGTETIPNFDCHQDCPVSLLDEQTGVLKSGDATIGAGKGVTKSQTYSGATTGKVASVYADKGGASRFFYNAKVSKRERNAGLPNGKKNDHPTCKPIAVMAWLCRLVTPPEGVVLDPFMGSGSTGVAAINEGFTFMGIDIEPQYCNIAFYRLKGALG